MDVLPTSDPEEVVTHVRDLQINLLDEQEEAVEEMGIVDAEQTKTALQQIFDRLQALRQENQALEKLQTLVDANSPSAAIDAIEDLRNRVQSLEDQKQVLADAGFERPEHAVQALASMKEQLDELYGEKEATERSVPEADVQVNGDTFDQLKALMAREEKLQRELGVSSPDAVIEIVEGLTDQLEDLYQDRDADSSTNSIFAPANESSSQPSKLEDALGTADPDALIQMVNGLTDQLDVLYESRERLAELNLDGVDEAIEMVRSMHRQLDALYEQQDQMSEHGIDGIDHALSIIENMEAQLSELYDERARLVEEDVEIPNEVRSRLDALEDKLDLLIEEKERLRDKRDEIQTQFDDLESQIGAGNADAVAQVIDDLEHQLESAHETSPHPDQDLSPDDPLLPEDTLAQLEDLDDNALDSLPAGLFCVDDQGVIQKANANVLHWPDVEVDRPMALVGSNFFDDVAPATKNALFQGRFEKGVDESEMNEQFFYTYVSQRDETTNLLVHLHRTPDASLNWILFRVV